MELNIVCGTWIRDDDETVLELLRNSERWLTVEEISEQTGLPADKVKHTLSKIIQQMQMGQSRQKLREFLES